MTSGGVRDGASGAARREQTRVRVLQLLAEHAGHDAGLRRAVILGYLSGTVHDLTPQDHAAATLGALDALTEIEERPATTAPTEGVPTP